MRQQPVPRVHNTDVARIIRRDFPEALERQVWQTLAALDDASPRVQLAVLKLADGDLNALVEYVEVAKTDYRDVLAAAEYPANFNLPRTATKKEQEASYDADWRQYQKWLTQ